MALINCPECNREVSDRAESCPHCGFPIKVIETLKDSAIYTYNGKQYDISYIHSLLSQKQKVNAIKEFREITGCSLVDAKRIVENLEVNPSENTYKIKCPKCGSSNFDMVKRNWSMLTGFMTNKVDRVCRSCKYKF